ncbi:hypothetical protein LGH82_22940 [Mesorhizobium sp. PAMC28654]|uniref:hypothetical protein n=1 Tax=Mesorhizobium sp. PAMC28654 TaxID=2880934 RepID=UPI001D0B155A|nr:hypothetical protein LGH82_22940 [Mesorhizobium sp. PAMC28654]
MGIHGVVTGDQPGAVAMATFREMRVHEIVEDGSLSTEQKIAELRDIESEARGLQRAASESPMGDDDGWQDELRQVRFALEKLGAKEPRKGAATL